MKNKQKHFFIHILASTAPGKLEGYGKNTFLGCALKDHKKVLSAHKNVKYSLTSLPSPVLCCTPSLVNASCPHRKRQHQEEILPGTRKRGWNQGCSGTSTCERDYQPLGKQTGLISGCTCGKEKIEDTQVSALLTCTPGALVLTLKMCPESRKKMQRNNWPKLSHNLLFILLFLKA